MPLQEDRYDEQGMELRDHGTAAFPIAHYGGDWKQASVPLHWHSELEAGFVTAGQVTLFVGREKRILHAGQGFFINSGIPHGFLEAEEDMSRQRSVVFDPILVGGRFDSVFWRKYVQPVTAAASQPLCCFDGSETWHDSAVDSIRTVWELCETGGEDFELEVRSHLSRLLALVCSHLPREEAARARHIQRDNERIRIMMGFIQANFTEELTLTQIADSAMISPSECLRCFHNTIGLTPIQYTNYYRIQRAARAILETDQKIAEIGSDCGFQEMSYFAKVFRQFMGVTPSQYRRQHAPNKEKNASQ